MPRATISTIRWSTSATMTPRCFPEDRKRHLIGFLAESLDRPGLRNPPEDFRRPPVGPLPTGLKEDAEMDLDRRPTGLFICVAD